MKIVNLDQRSPEWLLWRNTGLGSSDAASIVGISPWTTREELLKQKREAIHEQKPPANRESSAMARGRRLEPVAAAAYEQLMGLRTQAACAVHGECEYLKASFDGLTSTDPTAEGLIADQQWSVLSDYLKDNPQAKVLPIEIKAPNRDAHTKALAGEVPDYYLPQCHHLLLVSGAPLLHYVSYSDYFPPAQRLAVVPVHNGPDIAVTLLEMYAEFWGEVTYGAKT